MLLFIVPFLVPILTILAATLTIVATTMQWLSPFFIGIGNFIVWYFKQFFAGLKAILQNLSTVTVIVVVVLAVWLHVRQKEQADCLDEVNKQRAHDNVIIAGLQRQIRAIDKDTDESQDIVSTPRKSGVTSSKTKKKTYKPLLNVPKEYNKYFKSLPLSASEVTPKFTFPDTPNRLGAN